MKRLAILVSTVALALGMVALAQREFLTIGTASVVGIYYPVGGATAQIINQADIGLRATVEVTGGSAFNARALGAGDLDVAIAQSDVVYQAYHGERGFEGESIDTLRTVAGLHPEPLYLVCDQAAGVETVHDIEGLRVNLGNPGSGFLFTTQQTLEALGISEDDVQAEYLRAGEGPDLLRDGRLDCFFYVVGIGSAAITDVAATVDVDLISLTGPEFDQLVEEFPYYAFATAPAGTYPGVDYDVTMYGVKALFVTTTDQSEDRVYEITKAILDNFDAFTGAHPALGFLEPAMLLEGLAAPLHPGAERAYREAGLLE